MEFRIKGNNKGAKNPNPNKKPPPLHRQKTGARERNVGQREKSILYVPKEDLGEDKYVMES